MPSALVNNHSLHYELHGQASDGAAALVLLHGLGSSSADWELQLPVFGAQSRLILPDLRGHGRSQVSNADYTVEDLADDVATLLEQLREPPAHVLGLSLGGCAAMALAVHHPECVRSLILVNTCAHLRPAGLRGFGRVITRLRLVALAPMPALAAYVAHGLFPKPEQRPYFEVAVARLSRNARRPYLAALRAIARFDLRRQLGRVRCPTLIIAGDRDQTVPRSASLALQRGIPGARLRLIPDSGHATPYDQADIFNACVIEHLREIRN